MASPKVKGRTDFRSFRLQVFNLLSTTYAYGATLAKIRQVIWKGRTSGLPGTILRGEVSVGRIKRGLILDHGDSDKKVNGFTLTALGKKHLKQGIIDSWARENDLVFLGRNDHDQQDG